MIYSYLQCSYNTAYSYLQYSYLQQGKQLQQLQQGKQLQQGIQSDLGHSLLTTRQRDGQSPSEIGSAEKDIGGQRHHAFMVCHASCGSSGLEPYSSIGSARQCGCTIL